MKTGRSINDLAAEFTRQTDAKQDYDRASELEELGANVIELPRRDWEGIAKAA